MKALFRFLAALYAPIDRFFDRRIKEHIGDDEEEAKIWQSMK